MPTLPTDLLPKTLISLFDLNKNSKDCEKHMYDLKHFVCPVTSEMGCNKLLFNRGEGGGQVCLYI